MDEMKIRAEERDPDRSDSTPPFPRHRRRLGWMTWVALVVVYVGGGLAAHLLHDQLQELTLAAYVVADIAGLAFILRYLRTDWRAHPWGRHVMAFMSCLEVLFTLAVSRRIFGAWIGLEETAFLASWTLAGIIIWRYELQRHGDRRVRNHPTRDD